MDGYTQQVGSVCGWRPRWERGIYTLRSLQEAALPRGQGRGRTSFFLGAPQKEPILPTPSLWTSGLPNCTRISFYCRKSPSPAPVCVHLLQEPREASTLLLGCCQRSEHRAGYPVALSGGGCVFLCCPWC